MARARAESVRVSYVAATRARDLLVVPAIGDDPRARNWDRAANWWVAPLYPALYPAPGRRRQPNDSGRFGWFGEDSVVERPSSRRAAEDNVLPACTALIRGLRRLRTGAEPTRWFGGTPTN